MTIYVKESGYNYFFRVDCAICTSRRGNEYLHIISADEISRSAYYKQPAAVRFVFPDKPTNNGPFRIVAFANDAMFDRLRSLS